MTEHTAAKDEPHVHRFDPVSGWCVSGCVGYRDDDRLIHKGGAVFRPGRTSAAHVPHPPEHEETR